MAHDATQALATHEPLFAVDLARMPRAKHALCSMCAMANPCLVYDICACRLVRGFEPPHRTTGSALWTCSTFTTVSWKYLKGECAGGL